MRNCAKSISIILGCAALALLPSNAAGQFNNPPIANGDSFSTESCQELIINLTSNDTDPESNYPLTVTAVDTTLKGRFFIVSPSSVMFRANGGNGGDILTYTIQDSLGASSTGHLDFWVFAAGCP